VRHFTQIAFSEKPFQVVKKGGSRKGVNEPPTLTTY